MANKNIMGSEVVDGFSCKPKKLDPNKPIMHYKTQIFICNGDRCKSSYNDEDYIQNMREIVKDLKLDIGMKRIKITKSGCFGACRFRGVVFISENTKNNGFLANNGVWLKKVNKFDKNTLTKLFLDLSLDVEIEKEYTKNLIPMKIYE